jgi:membrane protein implicated in regulation of membrane protease activity
VLRAVDPFTSTPAAYGLAAVLMVATGIIETALGAWWVGLVDLLAVAALLWAAVRAVRRQRVEAIALRVRAAELRDLLAELDARLATGLLDQLDQQSSELREIRAQAGAVLAEMERQIA